MCLLVLLYYYSLVTTALGLSSVYVPAMPSSTCAFQNYNVTKGTPLQTEQQSSSETCRKHVLNLNSFSVFFLCFVLETETRGDFRR